MAEEKQSFFKSSMFIRIRSGVILVVIALILLLMGNEILLAGLGVISLIGVFELYRVMNIHNKLMGYTGYVLTVCYYLCLYLKPGNSNLLVFLFIAAMIFLLAIYVLKFPEYKSEQVMAGFFGLFYVAVMLSYIYQCRELEGGIYLVWIVFLCSWVCDTCAYFVGVALGKHKMAPVLSPKKSIEGAIGGIAGAMLLSALFGYIFRGNMPFANAPVVCAIVCGIGSVISMIGDLAASAIKRNHDVKDYGALIPGHGGILDRFDSVIFTAPIIYYTILFFIR